VAHDLRRSAFAWQHPHMTNSAKLGALLVVLLSSSVGVAHAGGSEGSIGVGAEYGLTTVGLGMGGGAIGMGGASLNYDAGKFHVGGFLGIVDPEGTNNTDFALGARFYYHVHSTATTDFGIGGNLGMISIDTGPDRNSLLFLEPGFQIRAFVATNVALSFTVGLAIGAVDAGGFALTGQATGGAGVHYYFF
jgi:hypothetical protein